MTSELLPQGDRVGSGVGLLASFSSTLSRSSLRGQLGGNRPLVTLPVPGRSTMDRTVVRLDRGLRPLWPSLRSSELVHDADGHIPCVPNEHELVVSVHRQDCIFDQEPAHPVDQSVDFGLAQAMLLSVHFGDVFAPEQCRSALLHVLWYADAVPQWASGLLLQLVLSQLIVLANPPSTTAILGVDEVRQLLDAASLGDVNPKFMVVATSGQWNSCGADGPQDALTSIPDPSNVLRVVALKEKLRTDITEVFGGTNVGLTSCGRICDNRHLAPNYACTNRTR